MASYEININMKGGGGTSQEDDDKTKVPSKEDKTPGQIANSVMMYVASKTVQPFIRQSVSNYSNQISIVSGKKSVAEKINLGMEMATQTINSVSTATAGYAMGKTMGIGGVKGSILAIAISAITSGIQLAFKNSEMQARRQMQNMQAQMVQNRAGTNVNSSREGI